MAGLGTGFVTTGGGGTLISSAEGAAGFAVGLPIGLLTADAVDAPGLPITEPKKKIVHSIIIIKEDES